MPSMRWVRVGEEGSEANLFAMIPLPWSLGGRALALHGSSVSHPFFIIAENQRQRILRSNQLF